MGLSLDAQGFQFLLQKADAPSHAVLANVGKFAVLIRIDILQPVAVIQHAVRRNADAALTQVLYGLALDDLAQEQIHVGLYVGLPDRYLPGQRIGQHRVLASRNLFRIQHSHAVIFFFVQFPVDLQGSLGIPRGHHKTQLLAAQIALHRIAPLGIFNLQKVGQNMDIHALSRLLQQTALQEGSGVFQIFGICLASGAQFLQLILSLLFLVFQVPDHRGRFLALLFRVGAHGANGLL